MPLLLGGNLTRNGNQVLNNEWETKQDFTGKGNSSQSNSLDGNITVTVAEVYPNGNLYVRGGGDPKLVLERTHFGSIWLEDHNNPGNPLRCLYDDVRTIGRLLPYLYNPQRTEMALAVGLAVEALKAREKVAPSEPTGRQLAQHVRRTGGRGFAPRDNTKG